MDLQTRYKDPHGGMVAVSKVPYTSTTGMPEPANQDGFRGCSALEKPWYHPLETSQDLLV